MPNCRALTMWVVYERPTDFPEHWVARKWLIFRGQEVATNTYISGDTLEQLRGRLPPGLLRLDRTPRDEPHIVETWL